MLLSGISLAIEESIMKFLLWLDSVLIELLQKLYIVYFQLAKLKIFDVNTFSNLINNIYLIVGVVALFMLAFILLQSMIDPNGDKGTKQILELIKRFVILSTITCLVPTFFNFLGDVQNSLLENSVIPRVMLSDANSIEVQVKDNSTGTVTSEKISVDTAASEVFAAKVSAMMITVLDGLMYPTDQTNEDGDNDLNTLTIDASEWWTTDAQMSAFGLGCAGSLAAGLIVTIASRSLGAVTLAKAVGVCLAGGAVAFGAGAFADAITAEAFTWDNAKLLMLETGDFRFITLFAEAVAADDMHYTPILSTIAIGFMIYIMVSFCIDLAVRSAKLIFYQVMAPICFLVGIVPQKKELVTNWFKAVFSTWMEVFVRIACVCGVVLLVGNIDFAAIRSAFGGARFVSTLLVIGMVIFVKQIPKLLKEVTGIDSGDMKLGIKDKLKTAGAFALGAGVGKLAAGTASMVASGGNPFAFRRGWKGGISNIGAEKQRRQDYKDARAAGASNKQIFSDIVRNKFGFASGADDSLRKIDKAKEKVKNRTGYDIAGTFVDANGNTINGINKGTELEIDANIIEDLNAQKAKNISEISSANDDIRALDKKIEYGSAQIKFKSNLKGEAESKIDEKGSKVTYNFKYKDSSGNDKVFTGTFKEIEEFRNLKLSAEELEGTESLQTIRDNMVSNFIANEMSSDGDNKIKQNMRSGFNTIMNFGGYDYNYYDANGNIQTGRIDVSKDDDGNFVIEQTRREFDEHGIEHIIKKLSQKTADGSYVTIESKDGEKIKELIQREYDIVSDIDKLAKSSNNVLNDQKQEIDEKVIDAYRGQNEAIDNLIKQYEEQKDAKRKDNIQRGREASKKYTARK